ncbi:MAG: hypothetical protein COW85_08755 [Ignavibacteria bacterium CG22_combo_CG10-13_8_21_14_all_37_15]|nr:MAG: hypothetical protein COW85_08755 [Ignavibacteria bacterium CG22_combo_CG10-13_8_21_14_all_37_15]
MKKISILLIEDNRLLRDGIAALLKKQPDMNVTASFGNGENILIAVEKYKPNIVSSILAYEAKAACKL